MTELLWPLVQGGVILAALAGAVWFTHRAGKNSARREAAETGLEHAREAHEIDEDIARSAQPDLDDKLRKHRRQ